MSSSPEALSLRWTIVAVDPGRAIGWWETAARVLLRSPLRWLAMGAAIAVLLGGLGQLPGVGLLVAALLSPLCLGGWMAAAHGAGSTGRPHAARFLDAFRAPHQRPLLALGLALAAATLLIELAGHMLGVSTQLGAVSIDPPANPQAQAALGHAMLALLLMLVASLIITAALWFAPALVVLRGASAAQAVRASLRAVLDNGLTFLLLAAVQLLLSAAVIALHGAGWLVLGPLMLLVQYVGYREVFEG